MGNIIEWRAQIPFSAIRKLLLPGVKETQYRIWYGELFFWTWQDVTMERKACIMEWSATFIESDLGGQPGRRRGIWVAGCVAGKGVVAVIGFWLTAAGATCIWFDWTLAHPRAAVHITEHAPPLPAYTYIHTGFLLFALPLSVLVIRCLSPNLSVSSSPTLFSTSLYLSCRFVFLPSLPLLPLSFYFASISQFLSFLLL